MNEVSCRVFEIFLRPLQRKGVSLDRVVGNTTVSVEKLRDKKQRVHWSEFADIMRNLRQHFTDEEYLQLGRSFMHSPALRFAFVVARLAFSPIDLYRWSNKPGAGLGNQMFTCVVVSYQELSANDIVLELTLPDGYEVCWDFFVIVSGNNEELPRLFGLPPATVKLSRIPRGGRMEISVPSWRVPLVKQIWRVLTWPFTVRAAARELQEAHETLVERYDEIEDARAKLDRQATQLRTAHSVNDLVQRDLDLTRVLDTVAKALVEEAGFAWAQITLRPTDTKDAGSDPGATRVARFGAGEHDPPLERALEARGGEVIGDLWVAPKPGASSAWSISAPASCARRATSSPGPSSSCAKRRARASGSSATSRTRSARRCR